MALVFQARNLGVLLLWFLLGVARNTPGGAREEMGRGDREVRRRGLKVGERVVEGRGGEGGGRGRTLGRGEGQRSISG